MNIDWFFFQKAFEVAFIGIGIGFPFSCNKEENLQEKETETCINITMKADVSETTGCWRPVACVPAHCSKGATGKTSLIC